MANPIWQTRVKPELDKQLESHISRHNYDSKSTFIKRAVKELMEREERELNAREQTRLVNS